MIPVVSFEHIANRIATHWDPYEYNPHQAFLGTSGSGKSYLIRHGILPIAGPSRVVVIDVKPGGSRTWRGYGNEVTELEPAFGIGDDGTAHYHFLARNKNQVRKVLEIISVEGFCIVIFDDVRRVSAPAPDWGLSSVIDGLLTLGRESAISVLICANSSVWAPSGLRDQCGVSWLGRTPNEEQRIKFRKMAGLPKEAEIVLGQLRPHEFLYSDQYDGDLRLARVQFEDPILAERSDVRSSLSPNS